MYHVGFKNLNRIFSLESDSDFITQLKIALYDELVDWIDNTTNVSGGNHLRNCDEFELKNTEGLLKELLTLSVSYSKEELLIFNYVNDIFEITTDENHKLGTITMYSFKNKEGLRYENLNQYQLQRVYINELLKRKEKTSHLLVLNDVLNDNEERQLFNIKKETIDLDKLESEMK